MPIQKSVKCRCNLGEECGDINGNKNNPYQDNVPQALKNLKNRFAFVILKGKGRVRPPIAKANAKRDYLPPHCMVALTGGPVGRAGRDPRSSKHIGFFGFLFVVNAMENNEKEKKERIVKVYGGYRNFKDSIDPTKRKKFGLEVSEQVKGVLTGVRDLESQNKRYWKGRLTSTWSDPSKRHPISYKGSEGGKESE